jgi:hypothetical protein
LESTTIRAAINGKSHQRFGAMNGSSIGGSIPTMSRPLNPEPRRCAPERRTPNAERLNAERHSLTSTVIG